MAVQLVTAGGGNDLLLQTKFVEITGNAINTGPEVDLLSITITPKSANSVFIVHFTFTGDQTAGANNRICLFRLFAGLTGSEVEQEETYARGDTTIGHECDGAFISQRVAAAGAGEHTIKVTWDAVSSTWEVRPDTEPDFEHASLLVMEIDG